MNRPTRAGMSLAVVVAMLTAVLVPLLAPGDVVIDGGNGMYKDSQRHATELAAHGLLFVDAGVSGGVRC